MQLNNVIVKRLEDGAFGPVPTGPNLVPDGTTGTVTTSPSVKGDVYTVVADAAITGVKINEKVFVGGTEPNRDFADNLYYIGDRRGTTFCTIPEP